MRTLLAVATLGVLADSYTTLTAIQHGHTEANQYGMAALVTTLGPVTAVTVSVLGRLAMFAALAVAADRFTARRSLPLYALALTAAGVTWLVVLQNIDVLART